MAYLLVFEERKVVASFCVAVAVMVLVLVLVSPDHLRMVTVVMYVIPRPLATYDCSIELHTLIDAVDTVGEKGN